MCRPLIGENGKELEFSSYSLLSQKRLECTFSVAKTRF